MFFQLRDVKDAIVAVDSAVEQLVYYDRLEDIRNERYLHHIFSSHLASRSGTWRDLLIQPEEPTLWPFRRDHINLHDSELTRTNIQGGGGRDGNFDFAIPGGNRPIVIEWKGPKNCSKLDVTEAFLKLLSRDAMHPKIFAAVFVTKTGNQSHVANLREKLSFAVCFACRVHEITDIATQNLYVYVRSRYQYNYHNLSWGRVLNVSGHFAE